MAKKPKTLAALKQLVAEIKYESELTHFAIEALQERLDNLGQQLSTLRDQYDSEVALAAGSKEKEGTDHDPKPRLGAHHS